MRSYAHRGKGLAGPNAERVFTGVARHVLSSHRTMLTTGEGNLWVPADRTRNVTRVADPEKVAARTGEAARRAAPSDVDDVGTAFQRGDRRCYGGRSRKRNEHRHNDDWKPVPLHYVVLAPAMPRGLVAGQ